MLAQRPAKRHRGAVACLRCRRRKHRCDNAYPACGACLSANAECAYADLHPPTGYVTSLQDRLKALDHRALLADTEERLPAARSDQPSEPVPTSPPLAIEAPRRQLNHATHALASELPSSPPYLGLSSGFPLAAMMQTAVDLPVSHGGLSVASAAWLPAQTHPVNEPQRTLDSDGKARIVSLSEATMPDAPTSERLITAYMNKVHTKHPFLSPRRIQKLAEQRHILRPASRHDPATHKAISLDYCTIHLIYAIGARYLQLSEEYDYRPPADHYAHALVDVKLALAGRSLESLEVMILLSIYQLRSPCEPGIWSIIGATMRQAVECGLHRASGCSPLQDQRRKRIFWTIYMLERSVAVTLGRPFCLSERDIDVELPANVPGDIDDEEQMQKAIDEASHSPDKIHAISPALHIFRLHRIISRIQHTVHRVDRSPSSIDTTKITQLREALVEWRARIANSVPLTAEHDAPNPYVTQSYHILQYHKATLFLLLPTLTWIPTSHPDFQACATAAGQVGQLYKNLYNTQKIRISYSLLALHANLVAGLTLIYCFVADRTIFNADFSRHLRACSTVLYIIAERWPAARKARDCLERFVQATVEKDDNTSNTGVGVGSAAPQQGFPSASVDPLPPAIATQASQLGIDDFPQPDGIWDMLGSVFGEGDGNWVDGFSGQDFIQFS